METLYYRSNQDLTKQGGFTGLLCGEDKKHLFLNEENLEGIYVSDVFDSGRHSMEWNELHLDMEGRYEVDVTVWIFNDEGYQKRYEKLTLRERYDFIMKHGGNYHATDVLLYDQKDMPQKGRFACFAFHIQKAKHDDVIFYGYELSYPALKFTSYLPSVYQDNAQLEAYLSIFKGMYLSLEKQIDEGYRQLDFKTCDKEQIEKLLQWIGLERFCQYTTPEKLRDFHALYQRLLPIKDSLAYFQSLMHYLFSMDFVIRQQEDEVWIYMPMPDKETAMHIDQFLAQELPLYITYHVEFTQDALMDQNAYCNITSLINTNEKEDIYFDATRMK